ncbi:MAG TPA: RnfABCDGE type electron transport complex subunit D [Candidatus Dormibacteraeota bacterium]|nr:RnfABCDGE type electron transport complex subunit D [Candidatus Dormibacteraeota bacterium]
MLKLVDNLLDKITMYRLVLYYLIGLLLIAALAGQIGYLNYSPAAIVFSSLILVIISWLSNKLFASIFKAPTNTESALITALILALIISPVNALSGVWLLIIAALLSMASKYLLAVNKKHIFNPAAIAVVITAIVTGQTASWWVGTPKLLPFVILGGLLLTRKIHRGGMITTFLATALGTTTIYALFSNEDMVLYLRRTLLSSALFFLAFVMLTEPLTSPSTKRKQRWYSLLAGVLFPPQVHFFSLYSTPQLVLVISNLFSYIVSSRTKLLPKLIHKEPLSENIFNLRFRPNQQLSYKAGQYMEWTLPHAHPDSRGNRRYFTLASSPTESDICLGVKFSPDGGGSSFKKALLSLTNSGIISASQLGGDFVLPKDPNLKIVFIAGGIGITPFRSMLKYLLDKDEQRTISILYSASSATDFIYRDILDTASQKLSTKVVYTLSGPKDIPPEWHGKRGSISASMIKEEIPDYAERLFYISGPQSMVETVHHILKNELSLGGQQIKTDFFPGYA